MEIINAIVRAVIRFAGLNLLDTFLATDAEALS